MLGATEVTLGEDILDAIDDLVPAGVTLNRADEGWAPPWLDDPTTRRRPRTGGQLTSRANGQRA